MKILEEGIFLICVKLVRSEMDDLLDAVELTLWGIVCDILIYRAVVLFRRDLDIRFWGLLQIRTDQNKSSKDQII